MKKKIIKIALIFTLLLSVCVYTRYIYADNEEENTTGETPQESQSTETTDPGPSSDPIPTVEPDPEPSAPEPSSEPVESEKPVESEQPAESEKPIESEEPVKTEEPKPIETEKPVESTKPKETVSQPVEEVKIPEENDNDKNQSTGSSSSSYSGSISFKTVVRNISEKEDFSGKGISNLKISGKSKSKNDNLVTLTPKFDINTYCYECKVSNDIDEINIIAELLDDSWNAEIVGNKDLSNKENKITIIARNEDKSENVTYQINVIKEGNTQQAAYVQNDNNNKKEEKTKMGKNAILIICIVVVISCILIILIARTFAIDKKIEKTQD